MPRRCRGIWGDVGIAPYGGAQGVLADNADNIGNQHKPTDRKDGYIDAENYAG